MPDEPNKEPDAHGNTVVLISLQTLAEFVKWLYSISKNVTENATKHFLVAV